MAVAAQRRWQSMAADVVEAAVASANAASSAEATVAVAVAASQAQH